MYKRQDPFLGELRSRHLLSLDRRLIIWIILFHFLLSDLLDSLQELTALVRRVRKYAVGLVIRVLVDALALLLCLLAVAIAGIEGTESTITVSLLPFAVPYLSSLGLFILDRRRSFMV